MSGLRVHKHYDFIEPHAPRNESLSLEAIGLLWKILAAPGFDIDNSRLDLLNAVQELISEGYLYRFMDDWIVSEVPLSREEFAEEEVNFIEEEPRPPHYRSFKDFVFDRDNHTCQYCGAKGSLTLDHVLPRSRGGADTPDNLVTCCWGCNVSKSDRTPEEWAIAKGGVA